MFYWLFPPSVLYASTCLHVFGAGNSPSAFSLKFCWRCVFLKIFFSSSLFKRISENSNYWSSLLLLLLLPESIEDNKACAEQSMNLRVGIGQIFASYCLVEWWWLCVRCARAYRIGHVCNNTQFRSMRVPSAASTTNTLIQHIKVINHFQLQNRFHSVFPSRSSIHALSLFFPYIHIRLPFIHGLAHASITSIQRFFFLVFTSSSSDSRTSSLALYALFYLRIIPMWLCRFFFLLFISQWNSIRFLRFQAFISYYFHFFFLLYSLPLPPSSIHSLRMKYRAERIDRVTEIRNGIT